MASNFQSSFIPKGPVTQEVFKKKKAGALGVLVVSLFITSIIVSIALFAYKDVLKGDIQNLQSQLADAEKNIDKKTINEMSQFGKKLDLTKSLILKHQVISNFLDSLASTTVSSVQFDDFSYGNIRDTGLTVVLRGKATSYAGIALQENIFSQNEHFNSVSFSSLSLTEKGFISFDLAISVDPQIFVYSP